jgi:exopolyphosphatase/guanosine-5'-triphosphate,3'-diphosphate pyrophosphatase
MRFAIIDLGTNTFNLLIAERSSDTTFTKLFNTKIPVKLGDLSINAGYISEAAFQRGIKALQDYKQYLQEYRVEQTLAFATSAIRSASNGQNFVDQAQELTGISISVIDGNEEADFIYYGNRMAVRMNHDISLIMDIGGGSTEFILANDTTVFWKESYLLGAARLLDRIKPSDPITGEEINTFNAYLKQELSSLFDAAARYRPKELIGSSGAFDSVVDIIAGKFNTQELVDEITEYDIDLTKYADVSAMVKASTIEERNNMKGLINMRVDMMVISVLLIDFILRELNLQAMRVSTFSLKEGVISKKLGLSI